MWVNDMSEETTTATTEATPPRRRGRGCLTGVIIFIVMAACPILFFNLLFNGQLVFGPENNQWRIFLLQETGQEGVGVQHTQIIDEEAKCQQTSIRYFMFSGEGENNVYCSCMSDQNGVPEGCIVSP